MCVPSPALPSMMSELWAQTLGRVTGFLSIKLSIDPEFKLPLCRVLCALVPMWHRALVSKNKAWSRSRWSNELGADFCAKVFYTCDCDRLKSKEPSTSCASWPSVPLSSRWDVHPCWWGISRRSMHRGSCRRNFPSRITPPPLTRRWRSPICKVSALDPRCCHLTGHYVQKAGWRGRPTSFFLPEPSECRSGSLVSIFSGLISVPTPGNS